jgi:uncharacterized membrane protein
VRKLSFIVALAIIFCGAMSAVANAVTYTFKTVIFPGDTFTQLLGIDDFGVIAGYHGSGAMGHPNVGFVFTLPNNFTIENFPGAAQTQVIAINDAFKTAGFYIDTGGVTHGFLRKANGVFSTVDLPGTSFNQLLGQNFRGQAAGYLADPTAFTFDHPYIYDENGGVFEEIVNPLAANGSQATGINDLEQVCGFYVDSGGATHGFLLNAGTLTTLDFPGATGFTQALGLNDEGRVVGVYNVGTGMTTATHGFIYKNGHFQSVDDPDGIGTTTINGVNNFGQIVGFYVDSKGNTDGFIGSPKF